MTLAVVLLVATFLLTAFVTLIAQGGFTYHRATSEKVVRDWTRVAQDELIRRVEQMISFYGTYPILQSISMRDDLPGRDELLANAQTNERRRNANLVVTTFRLKDGTLQSNPANVSPELTSWLQAQLAEIAKHPPMPAERKPLHVTIGGRTHSFDYLAGERGIVAMEVDRTAFAPFFEAALAVRPLLPESLSDGRMTNAKVVLNVIPPGGRPIFTTPGAFDREFGNRRKLDAGWLRDFTIETSIAPDVARLLVFGGLKRNPPIHFAVLGLTAVLVVIAIVLLRKERRLARMRSEFVAGVSHELRTPLTQIRMFAETLLLDRVRSEEERRRSLTIIDQESRRLAQLVDNVLQFSRGERGTLAVTRTPRDVGALVRETIETFAPIAAARNVRITTRIDEDTTAAVDDDAMRQVILNLLDNAVKYGPVGQEIAVTVTADAERVRIAVEDRGPGIPPRDRARIWRRYERLPRERERAIAGAGIGLAVVREIVALHGGRAFAEDADGGGARFVVEVSR